MLHVTRRQSPKFSEMRLEEKERFSNKTSYLSRGSDSSIDYQPNGESKFKFDIDINYSMNAGWRLTITCSQDCLRATMSGMRSAMLLAGMRLPCIRLNVCS